MVTMALEAPSSSHRVVTEGAYRSTASQSLALKTSIFQQRRARRWKIRSRFNLKMGVMRRTRDRREIAPRLSQMGIGSGDAAKRVGHDKQGLGAARALGAAVTTLTTKAVGSRLMVFDRFRIAADGGGASA